MPSNLKIVHFPRYNNPYQDLLLSHLKEIGLVAVFGKETRIRYLGDVSILYNVIKDPDVHILHLHWPHRLLVDKGILRTFFRSVSFILQILIVKAIGKKVVWTAHNITNHEGKHTKLELFFTHIFAHLVDAIFVHCQTAKQKIFEVYKVRNKITVIPHGNYLNVYSNSLSQNEARSLLNVSSTAMMFLFLGNIRPYKGVTELIESFRKIDKHDIKLVIAGRLDDHELAGRINGTINGTGNIKLISTFISDDDIQLYMNAADIVVLPYRNILTSGAVMLAMSFGKAIIAPKIGCLRDTLDNSGSFLYNSADKDGLLNALKKSIAARKKVGQMGYHNLDLAGQLGWRETALKTMQVYERCLNCCQDY